MNAGRAALFLDRDGVLVEDVDLLVPSRPMRVLAGVPEALARARDAGFRAVVVSNQTIVARGIADEDAVRDANKTLAEILAASGAVIDAFYVCPHHPNATVERYRVACQCRKPRPGMLLSAARELDIDLAASVMVGDRMSDVAAGFRAGCKTVLVETGMHAAPPIESPDGPVTACPDLVCNDLRAAVEWIVGGSR